jgi:oligopeptide/dipeptide ABC transporter ATP-binding protein
LDLRRRDGVCLLAPFELTLLPGQRVALAGESGSGKSLLLQAIFGVLPPGVYQAGGTIEAFGTPLDRPNRARDHIRGNRLAWVPQDPLAALNPFLMIQDQLTLLPRVHRGEARQSALRRMGPLLERLGLPQDRTFLRRFPQELSGGQGQRVALAMALSCDPELIVLDEPTSALDPGLQMEFQAILSDLRTDRGLGWLWITHDLEAVATQADRVIVLYGGEMLEAGPADKLLNAPAHPYTQRLLSAARGEPSQEAGFLEAPERRPVGCPFQPRCPKVTPSCSHWAPWQGTPEDGIRCEARISW